VRSVGMGGGAAILCGFFLDLMFQETQLANRPSKGVAAADY
jgi:hypothetical protein